MYLKNNTKFRAAIIIKETGVLNKLIIILFLFPLFAFTQNIEGIVLNKKDNLPIQDANIIFNQNNESTATDESGKFKLIITGEFRQSDSLYISHIGYATKKISLFEFKKTIIRFSCMQK